MPAPQKAISHDGKKTFQAYSQTVMQEFEELHAKEKTRVPKGQGYYGTQGSEYKLPIPMVCVFTRLNQLWDI